MFILGLLAVLGVNAQGVAAVIAGYYGISENVVQQARDMKMQELLRRK